MRHVVLQCLLYVSHINAPPMPYRFPSACLLAKCRITKIFKITKDLEHNNYAHVTNGIRIVTLASSAFLIQDVVSPPPALLCQNIDIYASQVCMESTTTQFTCSMLM